MARRQATTVNCENFRPFAVGPRKTERLERLPLQAETKRQALVCLQSTAVAENRKTTRRAGTHSQANVRRSARLCGTVPSSGQELASFNVFEETQSEDKENVVRASQPAPHIVVKDESAKAAPASSSRREFAGQNVGPSSPTSGMECEGADSPMVLDTSLHELEPMCYTDTRQAESSSEYAQEIYYYLRQQEVKLTPKPTYMLKQPDITSSMRTILVDWLIEVAEEYKLHAETLFLAVSYVDRFLSSMSVVRGKLQLVGTAALLIASKFEEIYPPDVREFVYITDDTYTQKQVIRMEHLVLKVLSFNLAAPTVHYFLLRFTDISKAPDTVKYLAQYLCELSLLEDDPYLQYLPSMVAGASLCLANHTLNRHPWGNDLAFYSGYRVEDFRECIHSLYSSFCNAGTMAQQAVQEKYKTSRFHCVANLKPSATLPF